MADPYNLKKTGKFWHCDFVVRGIRVHRSTKRVMKADAETEAKRWYDAALDKANGVEKPKIPTLKEVYKDWATLKKNQVSESHHNFMRIAVEIHAAKWLDHPLVDLNNEVIEEIRAAYLASEGKGYKKGGGSTVLTHSRGGANQVVKQLRALCNWAVHMKKLTVCPFKIKKLKPQEKSRVVLWPEQVQAFIAEADRGGPASQSKKSDRKPPQSATALRMMVSLGLREGEVLQADWGWVDWRRSVFVVGGIAMARDVTVKDASIREIPIPDWLLKHLKGIWEEAKSPAVGLILPAPDGAQHECQFTTKPVARCARKLGVHGLTPHRLRATWATGHFEIGTPLSQIQQMMGHESPETTLKYIVQRPMDQAVAQANLAARMGFQEEVVEGMTKPVTQKSPVVKGDISK